MFLFTPGKNLYDTPERGTSEWGGTYIFMRKQKTSSQARMFLVPPVRIELTYQA